MRLLGLVALIAVFGAFAQVPPFPAAPPDEAKVQMRISELTPPDKGLPSGTVALVDERRLVENERQSLQGLNAFGNELASQIDAVSRAKTTVNQVMSEIGSMDCKTVTSLPFAQADRLNFSLVGMQNRVGLTFDPDSPWSAAPIISFSPSQISPAMYCAQWKSFLSDSKRQANLLGYFDQQTNRLQNDAKHQAEFMKQVATLSELLEKRRDTIDKRISAQETKSQLADRLWLLIAAIGILSIATIMAVKLFSDEIQLEWVASGQVIQFVTVMILLSVVLALGLAEILKENTLGTLLGGIGGYVLAQGVGRAAAREVSRGQNRITAPRANG